MNQTKHLRLKSKFKTSTRVNTFKKMIHEQLPLPVPCYDLALLTESSLGRLAAHFGYPQLAWLDGRWVQDSGTYSSPHSWLAITSDSSFMRASFSPQSELRLALMRLAWSCDFASHCTNHCTTCAAQDIKGHADLASSSPSSQLSRAVPCDM